MAKGQSRTKSQSSPQLNTGEIAMKSGCDTSRNGHVRRISSSATFMVVL